MDALSVLQSQKDIVEKTRNMFFDLIDNEINNIEFICQYFADYQLDICDFCGITQRQLANEAGITRQTLTNYKNGTRNMTIETFLKILKVISKYNNKEEQ